MTTNARQASARILRFFSAADDRGYCVRCERQTQWTERDHYYRCSGCGQDPVLHRTRDFEPARIYTLNGPSAA